MGAHMGLGPYGPRAHMGSGPSLFGRTDFKKMHPTKNRPVAPVANVIVKIKRQAKHRSSQFSRVAAGQFFPSKNGDANSWK